MGSSSSNIIGEQYKKKFDSEIQYELSRKKEISDVFNCEVNIYRERSTDKYIASFDKGLQSSQLDQKTLDYLQKRMADNRDQLIKIIGYFSDTTAESICGNSYQQYYFVDYPIGTLRNEIDLRKYMNKSFSETEIWNFLINIVEGLTHIKQMDKTCRNISSSTIFVDAEGRYRISELGLVKDISLFEEIVLKIYAKDIYLSPEQVRILKKEEQTPIDDTDPFLSDIFSLGALLVEMIYLENQGDLFKYNADEGVVVVKVTGLRERLPYQGSYSHTLLRLVSQMIEKKAKNRINLEELQEQVQISYNHYLENEYGEEGGKAVKMQQDGKTSFLEYILRRSEYEKMYKQNGINEEDDLMEQQMRRAKANKKRNYTSKISVAYLDGEESEEMVKQENIPLSRFLAQQNEKNKEDEDEDEDKQKSKIIEEESQEDLQDDIEQDDSQEDKKVEVNMKSRRGSRFPQNQQDQSQLDQENQQQPSPLVLRLQGQQQFSQQSSRRSSYQYQYEPLIASKQSSYRSRNSPHNSSRRSSLPLSQSPQHFKRNSIQYEATNDQVIDKSNYHKLNGNASRSMIQQGQANNNQQRMSLCSRPGSSSPMGGQRIINNKQNFNNRRSSSNNCSSNCTPTNNNKQCNIDRFAMRISKHNVVSDKFSQLYNSFKQISQNSCYKLMKSNTNSYSNSSNYNYQRQIPSKETSCAISSSGFRNNVVKKQSISQILLGNNQKTQQTATTTANNDAILHSPLRVIANSSTTDRFDQILKTSSKGKFLQNNYPFSQGYSLTANKTRFLSQQLSISPI